MKEFDHTELDDSQSAFLTRLNRMRVIVEKFGENAADRNELTIRLIPYLHDPELSIDMHSNMVEHASYLEEMCETLELLGKDVIRMGDAITEHMEYLDALVEEIKKRAEEEGLGK